MHAGQTTPPQSMSVSSWLSMPSSQVIAGSPVELEASPLLVPGSVSPVVSPVVVVPALVLSSEVVLGSAVVETSPVLTEVVTGSSVLAVSPVVGRVGFWVVSAALVSPPPLLPSVS